MYVQFSVPDRISYSDIDGLTQDWYQPVHEPGNVFSYPWSLAELQARYTEQVNPLTGPATCMAIGNSNSSYSTQWTSGHTQDSSSGSTSSFSHELSMSYSEGAGVTGVDAANFNFSMDVAASTSLNTLNESSTSMSTSKAISVNIPQFGYAATCCNYAFGGYVFGLKNIKNPASEVACAAGQTPDKDGCTAVNDPDNGKPIDIAGTGPMFVGFLADPISSVNTSNTDLTCSGSDSWWQTVYTRPDVGVNHPGCWNWNKSQQVATFMAANSTPIVEDNYFDLMKGFFISKKGNTNGPNLAQSSASDPLTISARVYNFSLVNTTAPVHVRFYGQLYYTSSGSSEMSCKNGNTACKPGLSSRAPASVQHRPHRSRASISPPPRSFRWSNEANSALPCRQPTVPWALSISPTTTETQPKAGHSWTCNRSSTWILARPMLTGHSSLRKAVARTRCTPRPGLPTRLKSRPVPPPALRSTT
jgi:hypothetical protein